MTPPANGVNLGSYLLTNNYFDFSLKGSNRPPSLAFKWLKRVRFMKGLILGQQLKIGHLEQIMNFHLH